MAGKEPAAKHEVKRLIYVSCKNAKVEKEKLQKYIWHMVLINNTYLYTKTTFKENELLYFMTWNRLVAHKSEPYDHHSSVLKISIIYL